MNLEKAYDRTGQVAILDILKMHVVSVKLMNEMEAFNEDAKVCSLTG